MLVTDEFVIVWGQHRGIKYYQCLFHCWFNVDIGKSLNLKKCVIRFLTRADFLDYFSVLLIREYSDE